ncbi:hypothetical protein PIB30_016343 [Stylosanthes scabra]|uniref:Uncharacterized protein n=1 Tax=Stylosanthes scabra TaxID=79078 RepID=A0ABU6S6S5_9FABA|nr:hypothetical protein [Stylosanthes scabra]
MRERKCFFRGKALGRVRGLDPKKLREGGAAQNRNVGGSSFNSTILNGNGPSIAQAHKSSVGGEKRREMGAGDGARQPRRTDLLLLLDRFDSGTWKSSVGGEKRREMGAGDGGTGLMKFHYLEEKKRRKGISVITH